jgi:hypothetical protein
MTVRKTHLIEIDPVARLYHHKQLISFPGIEEIIFLFRRAHEGSNESSETTETPDNKPSTSKHTSAGQ